MGKFLLGAVLVCGVVVALTWGYPYVFSREITGTLESMEAALPNGAVITNASSSAFSAGVMIKNAEGVYITFSTEDRQWATLRDKIGVCVTARIFPYGWWNFSRSGTYYNGRLIGVSDQCTE
ncbi:MAG: hypothetical protein V4603_16385 [Pseudomonadota bacterium]